MKIRPCTLKEAKKYVEKHHRHNKAPVGHKISVKLVDNDETLGVAVLSRPIARMLDDGFTAEITRCCTTGRKNACSMLYGSLLRVAKSIGYYRVITYTQSTESGSSLKAAGFVEDSRLPARKSWAESSPLYRHLRDTTYKSGGVERIRWQVLFTGNKP